MEREEKMDAELRQGIVLPALTHHLETSNFIPNHRRYLRNLPRDEHTERLVWLLYNASIAEFVAELTRLETLYPGKYGAGSQVTGATYTREEISRYLTLWDVIDYPRLPPYGSGDDKIDEDIALLIQQEIVTRTDVSIDYSEICNLRDLAWRANDAAYRTKNIAEPGCWSMATDDKSLFWTPPPKEAEELPAALIRLHNCIPIPDGDVPISEVLDFKWRRGAELQSLRYHLLDIYRRIYASGGDRLVLDEETARLEKALADYMSVSSERKLNLSWLNISCKMVLQFDLRAGVAAGGLSYASGLPMYASFLAGLGASAIPKIEISRASAPSDITPTINPFEYVASVKSELFAGRAK